VWHDVIGFMEWVHSLARRDSPVGVEFADHEAAPTDSRPCGRPRKKPPPKRGPQTGRFRRGIILIAGVLEHQDTAIGVAARSAVHVLDRRTEGRERGRFRWCIHGHSASEVGDEPIDPSI
jgi:hypothetical protein